MERQDFFVLIKLMRPLLIILICWAHVPFLYGFYSQSVDAASVQTVFGVFLRDVVSRGGVPILTVVSGYLAYLSLQRKPYLTFVRDKAQRILLPYILWNLICLVYILWVHHTFGYTINAKVLEYQGLTEFIKDVLAINRMPINPPIYFLRDLFLILLLCPVFALLSRNKVVAAVVLVFYATYMFNTVTPHFGGYGILYRSDMPFFFFLGYLASRYDFTLPVLSQRAIIAGFALLAVFSVLTAFYLAHTKPELLTYLKYRPLIGIVYLFALPCMMSFLLPRADGAAGRFLAKLSGYSMVIFLSHQLLVYSLNGLVPSLGLSMGNRSSLMSQVIFLLVYTGLCILVGVVLKTLYLRSSALLGRALPAAKPL